MLLQLRIYPNWKWSVRLLSRKLSIILCSYNTFWSHRYIYTYNSLPHSARNRYSSGLFRCYARMHRINWSTMFEHCLNSSGIFDSSRFRIFLRKLTGISDIEIMYIDCNHSSVCSVRSSNFNFTLLIKCTPIKCQSAYGAFALQCIAAS